MTDRPRLCLLGAAGDTSNLGVNALLESTLVGLREHAPDAEIVVFDNGLGVRSGDCSVPGGAIAYERVGIRSSRRIFRPESLAHMSVAARLRLLPNPGVERMRSSCAVLDLSGGDSYSDIYGDERFRAIAGQKAVALATGVPLVLLPQTYGPFESPANERTAADLVRRCALAWARDEPSFAALQRLLGSEFDPHRHRVSVDVAFGLPSRQPEQLQRDVAAWFEQRVPVFGFNISGLLANDDRSAAEFGLAAVYEPLVMQVLRRLLDDTDARIVLVPHVRSELHVVESDIAACRRIGSRLASEHPSRVAVLEDVDEAQEVKWVIGRCTAFCGTRMHSTIAALSSLVPAMAFAYSAKTEGVFASCGQARRVVDLRAQDADAAAEAALALWTDRSEIRAQLQRDMAAVVERSTTPFASIAAQIRRSIPSNGDDR